jgi:hypothetical protein
MMAPIEVLFFGQCLKCLIQAFLFSFAPICLAIYPPFA